MHWDFFIFASVFWLRQRTEEACSNGCHRSRRRSIRVNDEIFVVYALQFGSLQKVKMPRLGQPLAVKPASIQLFPLRLLIQEARNYLLTSIINVILCEDWLADNANKS